MSFTLEHGGSGGAPQTIMPSPSTITRMSYELTALTYLHASTVLLDSGPGACLGWDATTMDDRHVNEVHLVMNDQRAMTVSVAELPGGDNVIYTAHLTRVVDRLSKVYSAFNSSDVSKSNPIQTKDYIVNKITCTISDRVSVNEVVCDQFERRVGPDPY